MRESCGVGRGWLAKDLVDGDERSVDDLGVQFVAESRRVEWRSSSRRSP